MLWAQLNNTITPSNNRLNFVKDQGGGRFSSLNLKNNTLSWSNHLRNFKLELIF